MKKIYLTVAICLVILGIILIITGTSFYNKSSRCIDKAQEFIKTDNMQIGAVYISISATYSLIGDFNIIAGLIFIALASFYTLRYHLKK